MFCCDFGNFFACFFSLFSCFNFSYVLVVLFNEIVISEIYRAVFTVVVKFNVLNCCKVFC